MLGPRFSKEETIFGPECGRSKGQVIRRTAVILRRFGGLAVCASSAVWMLGTPAEGQGGKTLVINGKVVSRDVRIINGRPYAPLADIARGMGQTLAKRGSGYELAAAGGANQVEGLRGKIGDTLFDGKW